MVLHRLAGPPAPQQLQSLVQPLGEELWLSGVAEAAVLVFDRPAQAGCEDHPAAAEMVQGGHLAGKLLRTITGDRGQ